LDITESSSGVRFLPMRRGEDPTHIVAEGEGWSRLGWHPEFEFADLIDTVMSYRSHPLAVAA
jgi:UDP-glucose 4-epimerase